MDDSTPDGASMKSTLHSIVLVVAVLNLLKLFVLDTGRSLSHPQSVASKTKFESELGFWAVVLIGALWLYVGATAESRQVSQPVHTPLHLSPTDEFTLAWINALWTVILALVTTALAVPVVGFLVAVASARKHGPVRDWMEEYTPNLVPILSSDQDPEDVLDDKGGGHES